MRDDEAARVFVSDEDQVAEESLKGCEDDRGERGARGDEGKGGLPEGGDAARVAGADERVELGVDAGGPEKPEAGLVEAAQGEGGIGVGADAEASEGGGAVGAVPLGGKGELGDADSGRGDDGGRGGEDVEMAVVGRDGAAGFEGEVGLNLRAMGAAGERFDGAPVLFDRGKAVGEGEELADEGRGGSALEDLFEGRMGEAAVEAVALKQGLDGLLDHVRVQWLILNWSSQPRKKEVA
jgi:hypothetical protein